MKAPPSGSGSKAKKTYYLHEAMQFILPFTKATNPTTGNLPENPQGAEVTDTEDLGSQPPHSTPAYPESGDWDPLSPPSPPPLPPAAPTPPLRTSFVAQDSLPLAHEQSDSTLPESRQLPQSKPSSISRKQPSGKKRKIPTSESDADRAVAEYYAAKKSTLHSKDGRKEAIQQFLNSLVPDLLTLTDPQLRSFKRRTLLLIDEVTGTIPLESICGPSYPVLPHARLSETPSPASTFLSSYDPSAPTTPQMEIPPSNAYDLDQTLEHSLETNSSKCISL